MVKYATKFDNLRNKLLLYPQKIYGLGRQACLRAFRHGFHLPKWKRIKLSRKQLVILGINLLLLIGVGILAINYHISAGILQDQYMAERWAGDSGERYTQVSVFLNDAQTPSLATLSTFSDKVDAQLLAASLKAKDHGSLWTYAYSATNSITVTGSYGSATANALGVGGNYFLFHPLILRDGSYISNSDLMQDRIVLDEETAWKIFGSVDLAGMTLTIKGIPYRIAGVVSREKDKYSSKTYTGDPCIYMSYAALASLGDAPITCYEIVLPDPISHFGLGVVKDSFTLGDHGVALENTGRFDIGHIRKILFHFGERTIQNNGIAYPYWENAARLVENHLALILLLCFVFSLFPAGCLIYLIVKGIKYVKHHFKKPHKDL